MNSKKKIKKSMFSLKWTKSESNLLLILHTLNLPTHYDDLFQVEWQRGDHSGETTLTFPAEDNVVVLEKRYCCDTTMYISKKDGSVRPKLMTFKVWRYFRDNSRKLFGKLTIDISSFWDTTASMPGTYTLESPHREKSQLVITFKFVTPHKRRDSYSGHLTDDSITTISETMSIVTDKATEWDVSSSMEGNNSVLDQFMETQHREKRAKQLSLSDFASPSKKEMKQSRSRGFSVHNKGCPAPLPYDKSSDTLEQFLEKRRHKHHQNQFGRLRHLRGNVIPLGESGNPSADEIKNGDSDSSQTPSLETYTAVSKVVLSQPASRNLMRSVLTHQWQASPVECATFPKLSAVLFTLIETTQILEKLPFSEKGFSTFLSKFIDLFESGAMIKNFTQMDLFVVASHLIALLPFIIEAEPNRIYEFTKQLKHSAIKALLNEGCLQSEIFNSIALTLVSTPSIFESVVPSFIQCYKALKSNTILFSSYVAELAVRHFDKDVVLKITSTPNICTFSNAISWNSFASRIESEIGIELYYLKDLAQCLMMNSQICQNPQCIKEMCCHLPPIVIYELLKNQTSDEYMPVLNDTVLFRNVYQKEIDNELLNINISIDYDDISSFIHTDNWDNQDITEEEFREFPFLKSNFQEKESQ